jgi:nitrogen regulatory protein P-II 1
MQMMMLVLDDPSNLEKVLEAWSALGVSGATIIESSGLHRHQLEHIPMRYAYGDSSLEETGNITLLAVVEDEKKARDCLKRVEQIVGDLDQPNTGIFSTWPLTITKGVPSRENIREA